MQYCDENWIFRGALKKQWSPEQIAGTLKGMHPDKPSERVSHETIYHTLHAMLPDVFHFEVR
ncbi:hypothetical protein NTGBS_930007 [Candidatus Nitrotoga sp. BS]|nr:hypothetical protein NTGBS_930007 [Candidatus Nitrotoga sp. BS]